MPKSPEIVPPSAEHLPLDVVRAKEACQIEKCGLTELYDRLNRGEYESYVDGSMRLITVRSIRARQERKLAEGGGTPRTNPSKRTGGPGRRKQNQQKHRRLT
jgi:hypothetical protein